MACIFAFANEAKTCLLKSVLDDVEQSAVHSKLRDGCPLRFWLRCPVIYILRPTMINYVTTSLFDSPAQTLVNTVNTVGVMGKGIAAEFKRRYPDMFARYQTFCTNGEFDIGKLYLYRTSNKWVLNFPTKRNWRNPSKLEYIEAGLLKFAETYFHRGITSISFPQLGCGNGGLLWEQVRPLMDRILRDVPIPIYIHVATPNARFIPEHDPKVIRDSHRERATLGFSHFWHDLQRITGAAIVKDLAGDDSYEFMEMALGDNSVRVYAEELEDLWNVLRLRGSLQPQDFPGELHVHGEDLLRVLLRLDYLRPMEFMCEPDWHRFAGIQFAPPAAEQDGVSDTAGEA